MTDKQLRFKEFYLFLKKRDGTTQGEIAKWMGDYDASYISKVTTGATKDGKPIEPPIEALKALEKSKNLNIQWLLHGEGDMFLDPEANNQALQLSNDSSIFDISNKAYVLNQDVFASTVAMEGDSEYMRNLPVEELPYDLQGTGTTFIIRVQGESMFPNFLEGEKIYIQPLLFSDWIDFRHQFTNGKVYVVRTKEKSVHLKRLFYSRKEDCLWCYSDNSDQETFAPFSLKKDDIAAIYRVAGKLSKQFPAPDFLRDPLNTTINNRVKTLEDDVSEIKSGIDEIRQYILGKTA